MNTPDISVIMSVYNGESYLDETMKSIICQTFKNWELIVINDCSTDSTLQILEKYASNDDRIKIHTNEVNLRLPSSLNKAISLCKGKYIVRMDADDICLVDRLQKQFEFMENNSDVSLSCCRFLIVKKEFFSSGGCGGRSDNDSLKALLLTTNPVIHPGVIAKAEVMKKFLYNPECTCTEDLDLWIRIVKANLKIKIQSDYLIIYRLHDKQITATTVEKQRREVLKIQKDYFETYLDSMTDEMREFYIDGIYFKSNTDVSKFCKLFKWAKKVNKKKKSFDKRSFEYAFFEVIAEYNRRNVSKWSILRAMFCFSPVFLISELIRRKNIAYADGKRCLDAAQNFGLEKIPSRKVFPAFSILDE